MSVEESALLDALRRGDEDAFARLVAEHHASLRRVARLYVTNAAIADEVVQDAWLGVIRGIWAFEGRSSLKTWIFRILVNRARTRAVRESRTVPFTCTPSTESGVEPGQPLSPEHSPSRDDSLAAGHWARPELDPGSSPERSLLTKELGEKLRTVIDALPSNLRIVLWLRDVEGWSSEDVCNALAIQETNQRVLLHRARSLGARGARAVCRRSPRGRQAQMMPPAEMTCLQLVELVTTYLEGALPSQERERFEAHRQTCAECQAHVSQMRLTISTLGQLQPSADDDLPAKQGQMRELFRARGLHRRAPRERDIPLGLGGELAALGDHIGYFWESEREFDATAGFLATGLSLGDVCVLIGHDTANERLLASLERRGLSVHALMNDRQLQVASVRSSADGLLLEVDDRIKEAVHRGMPAVRLLGNLNWGRGTPGWPSDREILRLEAHVTSAAERLPSIVVCAYDVSNLPGPMLWKGGLECHPLTFRRDCLRHNEHHVPPERFLEELRVNERG